MSEPTQRTAPPLLLYVPQAPDAAEWRRWALESVQPGLLIPALQQSGEIGIYPEIAALARVPQDPEWHPEGSVDVHTGHVVDAASRIAEREGLGPEERRTLLYAALTHDFGKPRTTQQREVRGRLRWTSREHDRVGVPLAEQFLQRIGEEETLIRRVLRLVEYHMAYIWFTDRNAGSRTVRRLASRLAPATMRDLALVIEADHSGRPPLPPRLPEAAERMVQLAEKQGIR